MATLDRGSLRRSSRLGCLHVLGHGCFTGGADILRSSFGENVLGPTDVVGVLGMDRNEDVAGLDLSLEAFGFQFRNAQTDQSAGDAADGCTYGRTTQRSHD